jgi:cell wall-associated NlpC family hydrolase
VATPYQNFTSKLGIQTPKLKGIGYSYTPTIMQQGQTVDTIGQDFTDKLAGRKDTGKSLYDDMRGQTANRVASDLVNKSAGLKFDEFGKPQLNLADFGTAGKTQLTNIGNFGDLATQTAEAKNAYKNAVTMQNLGSYGLSGTFSVDSSGTAIPGATSGNAGAQVAAKAIQVMKNGTPYVWGGNSLSKGIDCSGLVQQLYKQLGVSLPRTTYEQAKAGKVVNTGNIRPGDLVFYGADHHHVGIYIGGGKIVHAANSRLGTIESNLTNSNGAPSLIVRPY